MKYLRLDVRAVFGPIRKYRPCTVLFIRRRFRERRSSRMTEKHLHT